MTERCEDGVCRSRIAEFALPPDPGRSPAVWDITVGPDGNLWFTETRGALGRLTIDGRLTEFPVALPSRWAVAGAWDIASGPDGNLWFMETDAQNGWIVRMTPEGAAAAFPLPARHFASDIAAGSDGNLWFTEQAGRLGRITPNGDILELELPGRVPHGLTAGLDGALWLTDYVGAGFLDRIDPVAAGSGAAGAVFAAFPLGSSDPNEIAAAPDGSLWMAETDFVLAPGGDAGAGVFHATGGRIARRTASGVVSEFPTDTGDNGPADVTIGPDGNLWFTEYANDRIGRLTPDGAITEFPLPAAASFPHRITTGPDGNLWFTETKSIGRLIPP